MKYLSEYHCYSAVTISVSDTKGSAVYVIVKVVGWSSFAHAIRISLQHNENNYMVSWASYYNSRDLEFLCMFVQP